MKDNLSNTLCFPFSYLLSLLFSYEARLLHLAPMPMPKGEAQNVSPRDCCARSHSGVIALL